MQLDDLVSTSVSAIAAEETASGYALLHLGRALAVKDSPPPEFLPGEEESPYVFLAESGKSSSTEEGDIPYRLGFVLCVYSDGEETVVEGNLEVSTRAKAARILAMYIKDAVVAAIPRGWKAEYTIGHDLVSLFPWFCSTIDFEFREKFTIGSGSRLKD